MNFLNEVILVQLIFLILIGNTLNVKVKNLDSYTNKDMLQEKFLNNMKG